MATDIEWTHRPGTKGESWNMIGGCTKASPGCDNCWALSMSWRIQNMEKRPDRYEGVTQRRRIYSEVGMEFHDVLDWSGRVNLDYDQLEAPYRWKKPRTVFVQSMGDLFHPKVLDTFIIDAFVPMAICQDHTFLILTKRAKRMQRMMSGDGFYEELNTRYAITCDERGLPWGDVEWPLPNVWALVTAENQEQADKRIPYLLQTPAAVRGISVEPMLSAIDARPYLGPVKQWEKLDWVIIGAESGPNRRPFSNVDAMRLAFQCDDAGVPVFVKQIHDVDGRVSKDPSEWPPELQRREYPKCR